MAIFKVTPLLALAAPLALSVEVTPLPTAAHHLNRASPTLTYSHSPSSSALSLSLPHSPSIVF
jgi:hypothetical protein